MNQFSVAPSVQVQRSNFDRSHGHKLTLDADKLVPILVDEVLPGDTFNVNATLFGRIFSRLKTPVMDNIYLDTFYFFVPNRLVWDDFVKFMGEKKSPSAPDPSTFSVPYCYSSGAAGVGSMMDYYGIPPAFGTAWPGPSDPILVNALPFRAYNLIWNEWFRDQNLQDPAVVVTGDSAAEQAAGAWGTLYPLRKRGKRHDYFTSALLTPQKGLASQIPLGTTAPLIGTGPANDVLRFQFNTSGNVAQLTADASGVSAVNQTPQAPLGAGVENIDIYVADVISKIEVDLSGATAVTINALRESVAVQQLLELDNRGGTRYTEILRAHFQVVSPDARLQRPEFLGGGTSLININPLAATDSAALGQTAAFGTFSHGDGFVHSFVEHGFIIGLASIRADLTYQQGIARQFQRRTRYDYFWPTFAHLGEQAVMESEIFANDAVPNTTVFGYQERHAEYRYKPSQISGKFRSDVAGTLDAFHLAQDFAAAPLLDDQFIENATPMNRVIAVTTEPQFLLDCWFRMNTVRPMPVHAIPGLTRL